MADLAVLEGVAFEADQLLCAGPVEVFRCDEVSRGGDRTGFDTTAILLDRLGGLSTRLFRLNGIGGRHRRLIKACGFDWLLA